MAQRRSRDGTGDVGVHDLGQCGLNHRQDPRHLFVDETGLEVDQVAGRLIPRKDATTSIAASMRATPDLDDTASDIAVVKRRRLYSDHVHSPI